MIVSNSVDYFKAGQSFKDAIIAVSIVTILFATLILPISMFLSGSIKTFILLILFISYIGELSIEFKQFAHSKKMILSRNGLIIIEKKNKSFVITKYEWDNVLEVKYSNSRYIRGGAPILCFQVISYSTNLKGTSKILKTIVFPIKDFLSFFETDTFGRLLASIARWSHSKKILHSNTPLAEMEVVLKNLCEENHKSYSSKKD